MSKREASEMSNNNEEEDLITEEAPRRPKDDEPPVADANAELKWRGDPTETYSDWKIEIVTQKTITRGENKTNDKMEVASQEVDGGKEADSTKIESIMVQTYHVHRIYLACGARKSDYFARVFRTGFQEAQSGKSRIELEERAANAFPQFLDYLYQRDKELEISVKTATALHFLGEYFEVESLRWDARQFIKKEMSFKNVGNFLKHSRLFCNSSIRGLISDFLVNNILKLSELDDSSLRSIAKKVDQELWLEILSRINSQDKRTSESSSYLTTYFSDCSSNSLDSSTFQKLTDPGTLPHIDVRCALMLANSEDQICAESEDCKGLSSLQQRCATALADEYKVVLGWIETYDDTLSDLKERKPQFLLDLLIKSWKVAGANEKVLQAKLDSALARR